MAEVTATPRPRALRRRWAALLWLVIVVVLGWYALLVWKGETTPRRLPRQLMPRAHGGDRVLVIAPHADDEAIGAGVYMRQAVEAGAAVYVCLLTNGEGEELGAVWTNRSLRLTPGHFRRLGLVRQQETRRALARAGVPADHVFFLGYPNRGLDQMLAAAHWDREDPWRSPFLKTTISPYTNSRTVGTPFAGAALRDDLQQVLEAIRPTVVLTCHPRDVHRDHWPAYAFTRLALDTLAAQDRGLWARHLPVYTYLVHYGGWPVPFGYAPAAPLTPPAALEELPASRWLELPVDVSHRADKRAMLAEYHSQVGAYAPLIQSFIRTNELFATVPETRPAEDEAVLAAGEAEPNAESKALRRQPGADFAEVHCRLDSRRVALRFILGAPPARQTGFTVLVHFAQSAPDRPQALQLDLRPGGPTHALLASARTRLPAEMADGATGAVAGRVLLVGFPRQWLEEAACFSVVAISRQGRHHLDHTFVRTYPLTSRPHTSLP